MMQIKPRTTPYYGYCTVWTPQGHCSQFAHCTVLYRIACIYCVLLYSTPLPPQMVRQPPSGPRPHYRDFTHTLRHTTLGRTHFGKWSARRTDLYLTTNNTHNRQTSMPPAGFERAIPASKRCQTHALDCAAIFVMKPEGTRPLGRPRCRWGENTEINIQDVGVWTGSSWLRIGKDGRHLWMA